MLTGDMIDWFLEHYAPDADDWRASPLLASSHAGLGPTHIVLAGFDPLRDEGRAYAQRLRAADVPVTVAFHPGLVHGFLHLTGAVDAARIALVEASHVLHEALG
jgi:acetyl esterase